MATNPPPISAAIPLTRRANYGVENNDGSQPDGTNACRFQLALRLRFSSHSIGSGKGDEPVNSKLLSTVNCPLSTVCQRGLQPKVFSDKQCTVNN